MTEAIIVALIAVAGNVVATIMSSQKTQWRIEQLEKKQEKHNSIVERFIIMEHDEQTQWKRIDELREDMERLKSHHE